MSPLGIELSDTGIMAAAGDPPRLLVIDGAETSSPGFALSTKDGLLMGWEALSRFRLNPRASTNRFWDELGTDPIKQPGLEGKTCAELAYRHLEKLWDLLRHTGDEVVIAVPGFYTRQQLGILLGIADELSMPVRGFVPIALTGSPAPRPHHTLLHLDVHLHRIEITLLEQNDRLIQKEVKTVTGKGFHYLYTEWVRMVADEFVRTTRFDPFDQAAYEQELYNRLPRAIASLQPHAAATFTLQAGSHSYRVPLTYGLFAEKTEAVFSEVRRIIDDMRSSAGSPEKLPLLQITQRTAHLPGCKEALHKISALTLMQLEPGAGALGALKLHDTFSVAEAGHGVVLLSSRTWPAEPAGEHGPAAPGRAFMQPTHILHGDCAYPLTASPLIIGLDTRAAGPELMISRNPADIPQQCCIIKRQGKEVVLVNEWPSGTVVNDRVIVKTTLLRLGQTIRAGEQPDELRLIACVDTDEKEKRNLI